MASGVHVHQRLRAMVIKGLSRSGRLGDMLTVFTVGIYRLQIDYITII